MSTAPSGVPITNRTLSNSPQWQPFEHGQAHHELSLLSLREVILELAGVEDALRVHPSLNDTLQEPGNTSQSLHLRARQRVILHDLRRPARRRARQAPGKDKPGAPPLA